MNTRRGNVRDIGEVCDERLPFNRGFPACIHNWSSYLPLSVLVSNLQSCLESWDPLELYQLLCQKKTSPLPSLSTIDASLRLYLLVAKVSQ